MKFGKLLYILFAKFEFFETMKYHSLHASQFFWKYHNNVNEILRVVSQKIVQYKQELAIFQLEDPRL